MLHANPTNVSDRGVIASKFVHQTKMMTERFVCELLEVDHSGVGAHPWHVIYSLQSIGGINVADLAHTSVGNFIAGLAKSIRYAKDGITPSHYSLCQIDDKSPHIRLPKHIRNVYASWRTSNLTIF